MKTKIIIVLVCLASILQAQKLDSLLKWSAESHPSLKAAFIDYKAALEKVHGTGFLPEPKFSFGYFISSPETRLGPQIGNIGIQQMFPWKGTLTAQKNIAIASSKMKFERFNLLRIQLFQEVKQLFYEAENKQINIQLINENIKLLEQVKSIGLSKIESGIGSTTDVLRLNLKIEEMKTKISTAKIHLEGKIEQLALISGRLVLKLEFEGDLDPNNQIENNSIVNHPMIAMSKEKLAMNEAQKRIIAQKALPKFGIGLNYTLVNKRTDMNPTDNGRDVFMPKITMSLPIYRKKYRALSKMNNLENESIQEEIKGVKLNLNLNLIMINTKINSAKERMILYQKQIQTSQSILAVLQSDYENGASSIESILNTLIQLIYYQIETEKAITDLRIANSQLSFSLNKEL